MEYMSRHGMMRTRPDELHPGTLRVISVRMDYLPPDASFAHDLSQPQLGYISRYALGRDYHKVIRQRLKQLGEKIKQHCQQLDCRPFVDSAPILERPLAANAGLGWVGKHSLVLDEKAGSWFFLGELLINLPLPTDQPVGEKCGSCVACMTICPTQAIVAPYVVDARRCISYLTIELDGPIPEEFRPLLGNRIYGCDDCQWACPWNKYAKKSTLPDFNSRETLSAPQLLNLLEWDEQTFLNNTEGSAIRRIGHARWLRNVALAAGNALALGNAIDESDALALQRALIRWQDHEDPVVQEQVAWSLAQRA